MIYNSKNHLTRFNVGDTVYYKGRGDYSYYSLSSDQTVSKLVEVKMNEKNDEMMSAKIIKILGRGHDFLRGFFYQFELDNGGQIESFNCFATFEEYSYVEAEKIEYDITEEFMMPKIKKVFPILLSEELCSVQPMVKK